MQRLQSLDFMKGLAIALVVVVHAVAFGIFLPEEGLYDEFLERNPKMVLVILSPLIIASSWGAVFVLFTGITLGYTMFDQLQNPKTAKINMWYVRKVFSAVLLLVVSFLFQLLFRPVLLYDGTQYFSFITGTIYTGQIIGFDNERFLHPTMLTSIAYSMIIISTVLVFFMHGIKAVAFEEGKYNPSSTDRLKKVLLVFGALWILASLYLDILNRDLKMVENVRNNGTYWELYGMLRLFGDRNSLFPVSVFGFIGAFLGIRLAEYYLAGIEFGKSGYIMGFSFLVLFVVSSILFPLDYISQIGGESFPIMLQFANLGLILLIVTLIIRRMDMRYPPDHKFDNRIVSVLTEYGKVTLTIYVMEGLISAILHRIFVEIWGPNVFPWNPFAALLFVWLLTTFWYLVVRYWGQYEYRGSLEWWVKNLLNFLSRTKSALDPQRKSTLGT